MKKKSGQIIREETGQVFALVLIILALSSTLVAGFLFSVSTNLLSIEVYNESVDDVSHAEDVAIDYVSELLEQIDIDQIGDNVTFELNGVPVTLTVVTSNGTAPEPAIITGDGFVDTGVFSEWAYSVQHTEFFEDPPGSGEYVVLVVKQSYLQFTVTLSDYSDMVLSIFAKSVDPGSSSHVGYLICEYSPDGEQWIEAEQWDFDSVSTDYQYYETDLSAYVITTPFQVRLTPHITKGNPDFDIAEIRILSGSTMYEIIATVGETTVQIP